MNVMFAALSLILDCPGLELAVAVYDGLPTGRPLPCVPVRSGDIARRRFWPVEAWEIILYIYPVIGSFNFSNFIIKSYNIVSYSLLSTLTRFNLL